jgi:hypothetical protein
MSLMGLLGRVAAVMLGTVHLALAVSAIVAAFR